MRTYPVCDACNGTGQGSTWMEHGLPSAWCRRCGGRKYLEGPDVSPDQARYRAALEMLAQVRHVSGSAQAAFRTNLRIVDAVLLGADVRDLATVEAIVAGTWKPA